MINKTISDKMDLYRNSIDEIDDEVLKLLAKRAGIAQNIGTLKKENGLPLFQPTRAKRVLERLQSRAHAPLSNKHISAIWGEVMSACLSVEGEMKVAALGPPGSYSEEAAMTHFGSSIDLVSCSGFVDIFQCVHSGEVGFGLVPLENSTQGVVTAVMDLLLEYPVEIIAELSLDVRHCLLRCVDSLEGIKVVYAHAQSLEQCKRWLALNLPRVELVTVSSNSEGAKLCQNNSDVASVASEKAAQIYGLYKIREAIQDQCDNRTRFGVITKAQWVNGADHSYEDSRKYRTSLVATLRHEVGSLKKMIDPLVANGIDILMLQPRPAKASANRLEYYFFLDIAGHIQEIRVQKAIKDMELYCNHIKFLGSYLVKE